MKPIKNQPIIILDFGSQYTQLIGRRVRELGVYCEIHPYSIDVNNLKGLNPCGIILSGGPSTATVLANPKAPQWVFDAGIPVLGICYGMQTMAAQLGGQVESSSKREFGHADLSIISDCSLFSDLDKGSHNVWMSHGDKVTSLPTGFSTTCKTKSAPISGMSDESRQFYGLQFHPEVTHTAIGSFIFNKFVVDICQAQTTWTPENIIDSSIELIRSKVGRERVLLALSGGVDSSVVAALLHKAIGDQLVCVFVDTGLLRLNEAYQVLDMFGEHMGINIIPVYAESRFLKALQGVSCPEEKRKIIGHTFIDVFNEESGKMQGVSWLAQGTIYPDVIESAGASGEAEVIKSHHNVGGLPKTMHLKLLEPVRELFKDEVRQVGLKLGLPYEMVYRHPFPGPGLAVRILGEVKKSFADLLRQADSIFIEELRAANLYEKVSQAFAVFLPVKSVGVMGDGRRYDYVICLRAVETTDFMTASWSHLPWDFLALVSNRIINEVDGISRVTYDISGKPPATIEWE